MKSKLAFIFKKTSRAAFVIGTVSLIVGFVLSFMSVPASASESEGVLSAAEPLDDNHINACSLGIMCVAPGCDPDPYYSWSAPSGYFICEIAINYGSWAIFTSDGCVDTNGDGVGDYCADGIGTGTGEAERVCPNCAPMIGVKIFIDSLTLPSPTPTETDVPTSTPTETDVPTSTPTETDVPSPTPTDTDVPTSTPTETGVATSTPTETEVPGTSTPTVTGTPPTPTLTDVPTSTPTSTSTPLATVTGNPTSTATSMATSTATNTSTATSTVTPELPATLPPPEGGTTTPALVPVTGVDLSTPGQGSVFAGLLINLGIGMLGLALVFHGLGKRLSSL